MKNINNEKQNTENNSKSEKNKLYFDPNSLDQSDNFSDWGKLSGDISKIPTPPSLSPSPYLRLDISEILQHTLKNIEVKDFRKEADLTEEDKTLQRKHYLILVVQFLNEKAKELNLDIIFKDGEIYMYNSEYWEVVMENEFNYFLGEIALKMGVDKFDAKFFNFKEDLCKQFISESDFKYVKPYRQASILL